MKKSVTVALIVLLFLQLLIYIDRGIIPGCILELTSFIEYNNPTGLPSLYTGILQSAFIGSLSISSLGIAYLGKYFYEAALILYGMAIWVISELIAGAAYYVPTSPYAVLFCGRLLNGIGEAALVSFICPLILKYATGKEIGYYMGISCAILPVGTAIGYACAGVVATSLSWNFNFIIIGAITIPFVIVLFICPTLVDPLVGSNMYRLKPRNTETVEANETAESYNSIGVSPAGTSATSTQKSLWRTLVSCKLYMFLVTDICKECFEVIRRLEFLLLCVAYASFSASIIAFSTFGAAFLRGLNFIDDDSTASLTMGAIVAVSGILGGFVGGYIASMVTKRAATNMTVNATALETTDAAQLDTYRFNSYATTETEHLNKLSQTQEPKSDSADIKSLSYIEIEYLRRQSDFIQVQTIMFYMISVTFISTVVLCALAFCDTKFLFIGTLVFGLIFVFMTQANFNLAIMLVVPTELRSLAIAISVVFLHVFGDVPSPIIIGAIKDTLAPSCSVLDPVTNQLSPKCYEQRGGLKITIFLITVWFGWMIVGVTLNYFLVKHRNKKAQVQQHLTKAVVI